LEHRSDALDSHLFLLTDHDAKTPHWEGIIAFTSIEELRFEVTTDLATAIVVRINNPKTRTETLFQLRRMPAFALLPIMIAGETDPESATLGDGVVANLDAAHSYAARIRQELRALTNPVQHSGADMRLLRFLQTRPEYRLEPLRAWKHSAFFRYPLLEAFKEKNVTVTAWIEHLQRRRLIDAITLMDRTRHCPSCDFAHLNYVDLCAQCGSLDIASVSFLHCFACGDIAPESAFTSAGSLACKKCKTRLRQVGVDYDYALATFHCNACNASFQDPTISANCVHCGLRTPPKDLIVQRVCSWRLSELGSLAARTGSIAADISPSDPLGFTAPSYFTHMLNWMLRLNERTENMFVLLGIRFHNVDRMRALLGRRKTLHILDDLAARVRQTLHPADLVTRTSDHELRVLLPHTDRRACERVQQKIACLESDAAGPDNEKITVAITLTHAAECMPAEQAEEVLSRLDSDLKEASPC
jgi:GGDEF domain-containing protein